jgi:hypothetical protein
MYRITAYKNLNSADIKPLNIKREWMDNTAEGHAYRCFPVTLANGLGWGLSFPKDISFVWDGISDTSGSHVQILEGKEYCYTERANATISFKTGIIFETDKNLTMLQMPVPNNFIDGAQAFTTLISTSFFKGEFPCALRITKPYTKITIKANEPFIALIPISLSELQNSTIEIDDPKNLKPNVVSLNENEHLKIVKEKTSTGMWTNFYRDAVNYKGQKIGDHEVKAIRLNVKNKNE